MPKTPEEKAAEKAAKEEAKAAEKAAVSVEEKPEKAPKFSVKIYLEGHKQPYVKEFSSQAELDRAKLEFKKNKSIVRFE